LGIALLGFCSDEGVRRNLGRTGAVNGPGAIRKELCNLPCWFTNDLKLFDAGDIHCPDGDLEHSQAALASVIETLLALGLFPIVLGGGHETAYAHFHGLRAYHGQAPAIVNFDAHFDLRPYPQGGTSGTMFRQIADDCAAAGEPFDYLCVGVQRYGNTVDLFKTSERLGVQHLLAKDLAEMPLQEAQMILWDFASSREHLYVTICIDVFSSAFAPGVSATQPLGLDPERAFQLLRHLFQTRKVRGFDVCEVSPRFDQDSVTASLAKVLVFSAVTALAQLHGLSID
jgi:formiminoglutamase